MNARRGVLQIAFAVLAGTSLAQNAAAPSPLATGSTAPQASLLFNGKPTPVKSFLAGNRNLFILYPAACGSACDSTLQVVDKTLLQELTAKGVEVFAATPDAPADIAKTVSRLSLPYPVFSDPQGAALAAFHVATAPQAYLLDSDGTVKASFGAGQAALSASGIRNAIPSLKRRRGARNG